MLKKRKRRRFISRSPIPEASNLRLKKMNPLPWDNVAGLSGVLALGLGTYGALGFKPQTPTSKSLSHASLYHLVHTAALVAAPVTNQPNILGGLLSTGNFPFSGTCYAVAYLEDRKYSRLSPFGGFAFIAACSSLHF